MNTQHVFSVGHYVAEFVDWLNVNFGIGFSVISTSIEACVRTLEHVLLYLPAPLTIFILAAVAWRVAGIACSFLALFGLGLTWIERLWPETMLTASLVLVSVVGALCLAIPLGIVAARSTLVDRATRPILDFMQTMPPWVYLVPAVILFGLGRAPAVMATMIFAMPAPLRLTNLGIRQVLAERKELGQAYGATPLQILTKIELPSALPTIMVGVNQCIMLALSIVVLAGLIGAGGLGGEVTTGLARMMLGLGTRAGSAIVVLAIIFDRITQGAVRRLSITTDDVSS
jgi:glycine betaine/proline transport system permease protein